MMHTWVSCTIPYLPVPMDVTELVPAALAAGGYQAPYNPTHVQKLFFLIDWELADLVDGPHFNFQPFHYGPFDRKVYDVLFMLAERSLVEVDWEGDFPIYMLTPKGERFGRASLDEQSPVVVGSLTQCARWVRAQSFRSLIVEIYARYPDMTVNSRVPDLVERAQSRRHRSLLQALAKGASNILNIYPDSRPTRWLLLEEELVGDWHVIGDDLREALVPFPAFPT